MSNPVAPPFTLSREQVRELDRRAAEGFGVPGIVLMENAGRGCAELLMRLNPTKQPVVILCGPGNNGGDGFVIARHLDNHGWPVLIWGVAVSGPKEERIPNRVVISWDFSGIAPDSFVNYSIAKASEITIWPIPDGKNPGQIRNFNGLTEDVKNRKCWIVDALFGTGLSRALGSPFDELVATINISGNPVLAVDLPSGLDCDTGEPLGPTVRATHTATFVTPKKGFLNPKSKEWTGKVHVIDIGAPRILVDQYRT
jgi:NAD(P)H-hydrate epimerase